MILGFWTQTKRIGQPGESAGGPGSGPGSDLASLSLCELSSRVASKDKTAFDELHGRLNNALRSQLRTRAGHGAGREDLVEDLLQRTWMLVWKAIVEEKYDPERAAISTYIYAIMNNVWLTHLRTIGRGQSKTSFGEVAEDQRMSRDSTEALTRAELLDAVREGIRRCGDNPAGLTEQERTILRELASGGTGGTDRGIAKLVGISPSSVNAKKHEAMRKLGQWLSAQGLIETMDAGVCDSVVDSAPRRSGFAMSFRSSGGAAQGAAQRAPAMSMHHEAWGGGA